jgi:hypothetical protein
MADEVPSFNQQLRTLRKGKSLAVVERHPLDELPGDGINEVLARMRRTINAQVSRIRDKESGSDFRVESAATLTNDNEAMLAVVAVTRI